MNFYNLFKHKIMKVNVNVGSLGRDLCSKCDAKLFDGEKSLCCLDGKVKLRPLHPATTEMATLYNGNTTESRDFLKNIRGYNSRFACFFT